jgi:hypothetical protein
MFQPTLFRVSYLVLALCIALSAPVHGLAQDRMPTFPHDSALIDKIEKGNFMQISDDNTGRMDLLAVLMGASRSRCEMVNPGVIELAKFVKYLGSDSATGKYPSQEFEAMGLFAAFVSMGDDKVLPDGTRKESTFDGPWLLNPNAQAVILIGARGCNDSRFKNVATNLLRAIEHHMNWHDQKLGDKAPLMSQNTVPVSQSGWRELVATDVELNKQTQVMKQIADLQSTAATNINCVYGPKNPDGTVTEQVGFWYRQVPSPGGEFLKVSRKNPMATFGDIPQSTCPANLMDAHQKLAESQRQAQSKVDPSALPPFPVPLQLMMGLYYPTYQNVKKTWIDYQSSHNPKDQQTAIDGKALLLRTYNRSCNIEKSGGRNTGEFCQLVQQLTDEFQEIPDPPTQTPPPAATNPRAVTQQTNPPTGATPVRPNPRTAAPATDPSSGFPVGTQLLVAFTEPVDLSAMAGRTFRAQLARAAQSRTQILAPQGSEVELQVSAPQTTANMVSVTISVISVTVDGKQIPVTTQPMTRPISMAGRQSPAISQIPARNILPFTVRATAN